LRVLLLDLLYCEKNIEQSRVVMSTAKLPTKGKFKKPASRAAARRLHPSDKVVRTLTRFAKEDRIPRRWINGTDDPTKAD
jgi:hypothetical protein